MTSRSIRRLIWTILATALLVLGAFAARDWFLQTRYHEPLADLGALPPFSLTDQSGRPVTNESMKGNVWVADLIFTHCTTFCPQLTAKMQDIATAMPSDPSVRLVSVSVDPTHDTPDTLRDYAKLHRIDTSRWSLWTGPVPTIYTLVKRGFHLPLDSVGGEQANYPIIHSPRFVLIDRSGHMRGYYNGLDAADRTKLLHDIDALLNTR
jgi:protein SCO1/2